jgi:hypothetical protein
MTGWLLGNLPDRPRLKFVFARGRLKDFHRKNQGIT